MNGYEPRIGDEVIISAKIVGITVNHNPIIKTNSGVRFLIKESDIKSIRPYIETSTEDLRKGN